MVEKQKQQSDWSGIWFGTIHSDIGCLVVDLFLLKLELFYRSMGSFMTLDSCRIFCNLVEWEAFGHWTYMLDSSIWDSINKLLQWSMWHIVIALTDVWELLAWNNGILLANKGTKIFLATYNSTPLFGHVATNYILNHQKAASFIYSWPAVAMVFPSQKCGPLLWLFSTFGFSEVVLMKWLPISVPCG